MADNNKYNSFLSTLTILYIDNSSDVATNKSFFVKHFKKVLYYDNGLDALETFEKIFKNGISPIDIIITDIKLPMLNGFDMIKKIQANTLKIPIFIFTKDKAPNNVLTALKLKINHYIFKPLKTDEMISEIYDVCYPLFEAKLIEHQKQQLDQYLEVIDQVAITSKTDLKGNITFVNDIFCDIAQYTREELIGKPHNIVRHPDMPKEAFANLWETIKEGKTWKGKVKNRAKDGSAYNVNATIMPIYDIDETKIVGYMAVRFLTTDDDEKQREFKSQVIQQLKSSRLKEGDYKQEIKELKERIKLLKNSDYLMEAYDREKQRTEKLNQQIRFYEKDIKAAKQKGLDIANRFKEELVKSLKITKPMQEKIKKLEFALIKIKNDTTEYENKVKRLQNDNSKYLNRISELEDVIAFQDGKI